MRCIIRHGASLNPGVKYLISSNTHDILALWRGRGAHDRLARQVAITTSYFVLRKLGLQLHSPLDRLLAYVGTQAPPDLHEKHAGLALVYNELKAFVFHF